MVRGQRESRGAGADCWPRPRRHLGSRLGRLFRRGLAILPLGCLSVTVTVGLLALPASGAPTPNCSTQMWLTASVTEGPAPLLVSFALQVNWTSSPNLNWSFGDGSYFSGAGAPYLHPTHPYDAQGTYLASVHVTSGLASGSCDVFILADAPTVVVVAHAAPVGLAAPTTFAFTGTASGGALPYAAENWYFSDGSSGAGWQTSHTFAFPGSYTATFTVADNQGHIGVATTWVNVTPSSHAGVAQGPSAVDPNSLIAGVAGIAAGAGLLYVWSTPGYGAGEAGAGRGGRRAITRVHEPEYVGRRRGPPGGYASFLEEVHANRDMPVRSLPEFSLPELAILGPDAPEPFALPGPTLPSAGPSPATDPKRAETDSLRASQRVLIHLYSQGRIDDGETATVGFTQKGMVDSLATSQSLLSNVLRRMIYSGYLVQDLRHVRGMGRRLRVYRLTPKGERVAKELVAKVRRAS